MSPKNNPRPSKKVDDIRQKPGFDYLPEPTQGDSTSGPGLDDVPNVFGSSDATNISTPSDEGLNAPVRIPSRDKLAVKLVPFDLVYSFDEHISDSNVMSAAFWTFFGATLGVIVNWVTAENFVITRLSFFILVVFVVLTIFFGILMRKYSKRANDKMNEIKEYYHSN